MATVSKRGRTKHLQLDDVVGSQPELGPATPDGGYGWCVLLGVILIRATIPSLLTSYGVFIMQANEAGQPVEAQLSQETPTWNGVGVWTPVLFSAAWSLTDPWSRTIASIAGPRCIAVVGILLVALGLAITGVAGPLVSEMERTYMSYATYGFLPGVGASMAMTAGSLLLARYFRSHLPMVQSIARLGQFCGHITSMFLLNALFTRLGFRDTVLTQAGLALQALVGASLFRSPQYLQDRHQASTYTLLKNEDDVHVESDTNNLRSLHNTSSLNISQNQPQPPSTPKSLHDSMPSCSGIQTPPHESAVQPFYNSMPRPLFSDVELAAVGHDAAFFIDDPMDEAVVLYVYGDHLRRGFRYTEELRMLWRPLFYAALLLVVVTRLTNLAFWLLLPSLAMSSIQELEMSQALGIVSGVTLVDVCLTFTLPRLPKMSPDGKKYAACIACFLAAGGLYAVSVCQSLVYLVCAAMLMRLGNGGTEILSEPLLKETLGLAEYNRAHSLLNVLTSLLTVLAALVLSTDYSLPFWLLAWVHVATGGVWGIQPFLNMCCNKKRG